MGNMDAEEVHKLSPVLGGNNFKGLKKKASKKTGREGVLKPFNW